MDPTILVAIAALCGNAVIYPGLIYYDRSDVEKCQKDYVICLQDKCRKHCINGNTLAACIKEKK